MVASPVVVKTSVLSSYLAASCAMASAAVVIVLSRRMVYPVTDSTESKAARSVTVANDRRSVFVFDA